MILNRIKRKKFRIECLVLGRLGTRIPLFKVKLIRTTFRYLMRIQLIMITQIQYP